MLVNCGSRVAPMHLEIDLVKMGFAGELNDAQQRIVKIGLRNILTDSYASVNETSFPDAELRGITQKARVDATLSDLYKGIARAPRAENGIDPQGKECVAEAKKILGKGATDLAIAELAVDPDIVEMVRKRHELINRKRAAVVG
jgi:hypothetical protein